MASPESDSVRTTDSSSTQPRKSMLPVSQPATSKPTTCPAEEHSRIKSKSVYKLTESTPTQRSTKPEFKKSQRRPIPSQTTPSLSIPRSVSASQIEAPVRSRVRPRQTVLSHSQRLQAELTSLRAVVQGLEAEKREEGGAMRSEIGQLTQSLNEANSTISQLSQSVRTHQAQAEGLLGVLEARGIDPISGEEVLSREERREASLAAIEKTKCLSDSLSRQNDRYSEILTEIGDKRVEMFHLLTDEEQDTLMDSFAVIDTRLFDISLLSNSSPNVITEEPVAV